MDLFNKKKIAKLEKDIADLKEYVSMMDKAINYWAATCYVDITNIKDIDDVLFEERKIKNK